MKTHFRLIKFIGIRPSTAKKICIVVHRKELVKLSRSPPLQFTFNKKKTKILKKVKLVYLRMSVR